MNFFRKLKPFLKIELFVVSKFVEKLITLTFLSHHRNNYIF